MIDHYREKIVIEILKQFCQCLYQNAYFQFDDSISIFRARKTFKQKNIKRSISFFLFDKRLRCIFVFCYRQNKK